MLTLALKAKEKGFETMWKVGNKGDDEKDPRISGRKRRREERGTQDRKKVNFFYWEPARLVAKIIFLYFTFFLLEVTFPI